MKPDHEYPIRGASLHRPEREQSSWPTRWEWAFGLVAGVLMLLLFAVALLAEGMVR